MFSLALPPIAGAGGGNGGGLSPRPEKGIYYGDLYVIDRDADGVPLLYAWTDGVPCAVLRSFADGVETSSPSDLPACGEQVVGYATPVAAHWDEATDGTCHPAVRGGCLVPLDAEGEIDPAFVDLEDPYVEEADFGRLNLGRSPEDVLNAQAAEASKLLLSGGTLTIDAAGRLMLVKAETASVIDSPLENLALYWAGMPQEALTAVLTTESKIEGQSHTVTYYRQELELPATSLDSYGFLNLASALMGAAADKAGQVTIDSVAYINTFLRLHDYPLADAANWIGLNDYPAPGKLTWFYDFGGFSYDRNAAFPGCVVYMDLSDPANPHWDSQEILEAVFNQGGDASVSGTSIDGFAQSADDSRAMIEFIHSQLLLQLDGIYQIDYPGETTICGQFPPGENVLLPEGSEAVALPLTESVITVE